ncbi:MAG: DUF1206 domain-containing protein [Aggregatilineales bacterium]
MSTKANVQGHGGGLGQQGKRVAGQAAASPLMEDLMRLGYMVRGLVYGVVGILALQVALGVGGAINDLQGAIVAMGNTPIGSVLLIAILIGLIGYALWGLIRAVFDPLHKGTDAKGIAERVGFAISGISYGLLALATYGLITGTASAARNGAQAAQTQQTTASILSNSWGPWVVGIAGAIVMGVGLLQIVQSVRPDFEQQFQPYELTANQRTWVDRLGRFGTAARGVVFVLIGLFLFLAAYHNDPSQAKGIDGVLAALLHQPYGPWLLGIVALGLIAFGIYSALSGLWLRFRR